MAPKPDGTPPSDDAASSPRDPSAVSGASPLGSRAAAREESAHSPAGTGARSRTGGRALRVAVTRPLGVDSGLDAGGADADDEEGRFAALLRDQGLDPLAFPLQQLVGPRDPSALREGLRLLLGDAVRNVHDTVRGGEKWLLVTSRSAIPPVLEALEVEGTGVASLRRSGVRVAAVGRATAQALEEAGLPPDLVPERFTGDDLFVALVRHLIEADAGRGDADDGATRKEGHPDPDEMPLRGTLFVLPRAERARDVLPQGLKALGARVEVLTAYRVVTHPEGAVALARAVRDGEVDVVTFTSGSAVKELAREVGTWPPGVRIAAIGPVTAEAVREAGLPEALVPPQSTLPALAEIIAREGRPLE